LGLTDILCTETSSFKSITFLDWCRQNLAGKEGPGRIGAQPGGWSKGWMVSSSPNSLLVFFSNTIFFQRLVRPDSCVVLFRLTSIRQSKPCTRDPAPVALLCFHSQSEGWTGVPCEHHGYKMLVPGGILVKIPYAWLCIAKITYILG
jgi:hypothetical protein